jgi:hypothetical protein
MGSCGCRLNYCFSPYFEIYYYFGKQVLTEKKKRKPIQVLMPKGIFKENIHLKVFTILNEKYITISILYHKSHLSTSWQKTFKAQPISDFMISIRCYQNASFSFQFSNDSITVQLVLHFNKKTFSPYLIKLYNFLKLHNRLKCNNLKQITDPKNLRWSTGAFRRRISCRAQSCPRNGHKETFSLRRHYTSVKFIRQQNLTVNKIILRSANVHVENWRITDSFDFWWKFYPRGRR